MRMGRKDRRSRKVAEIILTAWKRGVDGWERVEERKKMQECG